MPIVRTALLAAALAAAPGHSPAHPPAAPRPARALTVVARDFAFEAPDTVTAGFTEIRLESRGSELHHLMMFRLDAGKTLGDLLGAFKAGGPLPAWAHAVGGPNAPAPGADAVTAVNLTPGAYALVCVIPSPDGTPHVMKGMTRALTVVPPRGAAARVSGASVPAPDVTMTLSDYAFTVSRPLTAGSHVVRVVNQAAQPHEVFFARLAPGKTVRDAAAWVEKMDGPPPMQPMGGATDVEHGRWNDVRLTLTPGEYALYCFVPDAKDGKPHVAHGMMKQFTVR